MNQKTTYEITITEKLGQLQVPDMREAIWSRIERQLDIDLPEDDNNPDSPDTPDSWWKPGLRFGLFAAIVAVVTIFLISKNNKQPTNAHINAPASLATDTFIPKNNQPGSPPGQQHSTADDPLPTTDKTSNTPFNTGDSAFNDVPFVAAPLPDSTLTMQSSSPPVILSQSPPVTVKQDSVPPKKSRGVKGIDNADYRINLKKDSTP